MATAFIAQPGNLSTISAVEYQQWLIRPSLAGFVDQSHPNGLCRHLKFNGKLGYGVITGLDGFRVEDRTQCSLRHQEVGSKKIGFAFYLS